MYTELIAVDCSCSDRDVTENGKTNIVKKQGQTVEWIYNHGPQIHKTFTQTLVSKKSRIATLFELSKQELRERQ